MRIALLGQVETSAGTALEPRDRAVLAVLAMDAGRVVSPDRLADAIWGAHPPASWRKQVQICVGRLRRGLGAAAIVTVPGGYRLTVDTDAIDTVRFEALVTRARGLVARGEADRAVATLERALALWRGPPLEDLADWSPARVEVARLEDIRRTAEEDLLDARLAAGDFRDVAAQAQALVSAEPLRERRWDVLARALYRSGRQADALGALRRARETLAERLGVDPGPELVALELAILRHDPALLAVPEAAAEAGACPYRGLAPYDVDDGEVYFGRSAEVAACRERLRTTPLLVVTGASGSGKSSMVRAGLVPGWRASGGRCVVMTPGDDPLRRLAASSSDLAPGSLLVVDQLEELFAPQHAAATVRAFCAELARRARATGPVVVTVRSDHLGGLTAEPDLRDLVERGLVVIGALSAAGLREAVVEPAAAAGLRLEDGLVELLLRDAEGEPGALPLLSHALAETWRRRDGHALTVEGYLGSGGIRGAVARTAEKVHDSLPAAERETLRALLLRLVTSSLSGHLVTGRLLARDLAGDPRREHVVGLLVRSRLLIADGETVELAHEALVGAWPRYRAWLDEDAAGHLVQRHLAAAAREWSSRGEPGSELLRGDRLDATLDWVDRAAPDLTGTERAYLAASVHHRDVGARARADRAARDAHRNRQVRALLAVTSVLLAVSVTAGAVGWQARAAADVERAAAVASEREARLEALVNRSMAVRSTDRGVAALLAVEAYRRRPDARAWSALLGTFTDRPGFLGHRYLDGDALTGTPVPGTTTAVVVVDGGAAVLDLGDGRVREVLPRVGPGAVPAVSADGTVLALAAADAGAPGCEGGGGGGTDGDGAGDAAVPVPCGSLTLTALSDDPTAARVLDLPFAPGDVAVSDDGTLVAVAGGVAGSVAWYRTTDGTLLGSLAPAAGADALAERVGPLRFDGARDTASVAFGPDGLLYVGSLTRELRVVDVGTATVVASVAVPELSSESHLEVLDDGVLMAAGREALVAVDTATRTTLWSVATGTGTHPEGCPWFTAAPSTGVVYCGTYYGVVQARDLASGAPTGAVLDAQHGSVGRLAVTADGRELVAFGAEEPVVSRWRLDGSGPVTRLTATGQVVYDGYDPAGDVLLVASRSPEATEFDDFDTFTVWDPDRDRAVTSLAGVEGVGWVGPGLLLGYSPARDAVEYYDAATGTVLDGDPVPSSIDRAFRSAAGDVLHLAHPDGQVWTVDAASRRRVPPTLETDGAAMTVASTSAGDRVVATVFGSAGAPVTTVHDGRTGRRLAQGLPGVTLTGVGASGVLVGAAGGAITRYDLADLSPQGTFTAARGEINSLQLSADGTVLLATSNDGTVSLFDVATGTRLGDPIATGAPFIVPASLHPDGRSVAVTTAGGVAVWEIDPAGLVEAACDLAGRDLTRPEWSTYLAGLGPYRSTCPEQSR